MSLPAWWCHRKNDISSRLMTSRPVGSAILKSGSQTKIFENHCSRVLKQKQQHQQPWWAFPSAHVPKVDLPRWKWEVFGCPNVFPIYTPSSGRVWERVLTIRIQLDEPFQSFQTGINNQKHWIQMDKLNSAMKQQTVVVKCVGTRLKMNIHSLLMLN